MGGLWHWQIGQLVVLDCVVHPNGIWGYRDHI